MVKMFGNVGTSSTSVEPFQPHWASVQNKDVNGTNKIKFDPPGGSDSAVENGLTKRISTNHQCITAMKQYENKSIEEWRWDDYETDKHFPFLNTKKPAEKDSRMDNKPTSKDSPVISSTKPESNESACAISDKAESTANSTFPRINFTSSSFFQSKNKPLSTNPSFPSTISSWTTKSFSTTNKPSPSNSSFQHTNELITNRNQTVVDKLTRCKNHPTKMIEFLCLDCGQTCCSCCLPEHKLHDWEPLRDVTFTTKHKKQIAGKGDLDFPMNLQSQIEELQQSITRLKNGKFQVHAAAEKDNLKLIKEFGLSVEEQHKKLSDLSKRIHEKKDVAMKKINSVIDRFTDLKDETNKCLKLYQLSIKFSKLSENSFKRLQKKISNSKTDTIDFETGWIEDIGFDVKRNNFAEIFQRFKIHDDLEPEELNSAINVKNSVHIAQDSESESQTESRLEYKGKEGSDHKNRRESNLDSKYPGKSCSELQNPYQSNSAHMGQDSETNFRIRKPRKFEFKDSCESFSEVEKYESGSLENSLNLNLESANSKEESSLSSHPITTVLDNTAEDIMKTIRKRTLQQKSRLKKLRQKLPKPEPLVTNGVTETNQ